MTKLHLHRLLFTLVMLCGGIAPASVLASTTGTGPASAALFRGDPARTGENPGPGPSGTPVVRWQVLLGRDVAASPVVVDGVVYVGSISPITPGGALYALDAATGDEIWHLQTEPGDGFFYSPAVVDGVVYVGSYYGFVIAADAATGAERWRFTAESTIYSSPAVVDGVVYVGDNAGNVYALDAATGDQRWRFKPDQSFKRYVNSAPAVVAGTAYVVSGVRQAGKTAWLMAIDAASGKERWHFAGEEGDALVGTPTVAAGNVYVNSGQGILYAVDAGDGRERWRFDAGTRANSENPAVVDGTAYFAVAGTLHAFDAKSGKERWSSLISPHSELGSSPTVADGIVYVSDANGVLYTVDAESGAKRWRLAIRAALSTATVVGGLVYVGTVDGFLEAIGDPKQDLS
jgi:outer membrane protein assembly factor BamB